MNEVLLDVDRLTVKRGGRPVLDELTIQVRAGEAIAVIGENGAGKSTLLQACAGLLRPDSGQVRARAAVGYCPQEPGVMELLSAAEHLELFGGSAPRSGARILGRLGFPRADVAGKLARELSGGTRQKLNVALALLDDAGVLLLDEPYQGFDNGTYLDFWELVGEWRDEGRAVVVVTHLLAESGRVDRVVELGACS